VEYQPPTTVVLDTELPILTNCLRPFKKSSEHTCSGMLLLINLFNNTLWSITSNALLKSTNKTVIMFCEQSAATNNFDENADLVCYLSFHFDRLLYYPRFSACSHMCQMSFSFSFILLQLSQCFVVVWLTFVITDTWDSIACSSVHILLTAVLFCVFFTMTGTTMFS